MGRTNDLQTTGYTTGYTVLLDRDGTINVDSHYVSRPEQVVLIPDAAQAIGRLKRAGCRVIVVTNQSAIGRGMATADDVSRTNDRLRELLQADDPAAILDEILVCPHLPTDECACRKPKTGLIQNVALDLKRTWMVGDKDVDVAFGKNVGLDASHCILVMTGKGASHAARVPSAVHVADLSAAVDRIVNELAKQAKS